MHLPDRILNRNLRPFIEPACAVLAQIPAGQSPAQVQIGNGVNTIPPEMQCISGGIVAYPTGFEPAASRVGVLRSIQLGYG